MMGLERWLRGRLNPLSSGLTMRWHGGGVRYGRDGVPDRGGVDGAVVRAFFVRSPGGWEAPDGQRPGWSWLPEGGAVANLRRVPRWVRIWYALPLVDRYAYSWMWFHGGWLLQQAAGPAGPPSAGVREPRRPAPDRPDAATVLPPR